MGFPSAKGRGFSSVPSISVLMPFRDAREWIGDAIESLLAQDESDWELLAVDDGSDDGSAETVSALLRKDPRVRLLSARTRGLVAALNTGLAAARGEFVARIDADDICDTRRLSLQRRALESDASLFAVCCRVRAFPRAFVSDGIQRYLDWQNSLIDPAELWLERFIECPVLHPTVTMRTAVLRSTLGGWRDVSWPEDWDLFLRAFEKGLRISRLPDFLYHWRLHPRQSWRTMERYSLASFARARAHYLARFLAGNGGRLQRRGGRRLFPAREGVLRPWIMGSGPIGKALARALADAGCEIHGFADVDARKAGGLVHYRHWRWPVLSMSDFEALSTPGFALAAVGQAGARERIRDWLNERHWREGLDFLVAA
ncbi:MAG: glycosyltransferase family 2 protein [Candidatus Binatia bacterium]